MKGFSVYKIGFLFAVFSQSLWAIPLKGVVLLDPSQEIIRNKQTLEELRGVSILGLHLPGSVSELQKKIFGKVEEQELNLETIDAIEKLIYNHYIEYNQPFIVISTPSQSLESGVVQFLLQESKIDHVYVRGNQWTSEKELMSLLHIEPNSPIDQSKLLRGLTVANRNPLRKVDVIYSPGSSDHTTDLTLLVDEKRPLRVYAGVDNTGVRFLGRNKLFGGFSWGKAFGTNQVLSIHYSASYQFNQFQAVSFQYLIPLPWQHFINFHGGYSYLQTKLSYPSKLNHGNNYQTSFRYLIPLLKSETFEQEINFGFDFKGTNNNIEFVEFFPVDSKFVNLTQFVLGYDLNLHQRVVHTHIKGQVFCSPAAMLPHQTDADFNALRSGATNQWIYGLFTFQQTYQLPHSFSLFLSAEGQLSSGTLLPSEELGIGGFSTVRGYDERELNVDSGLIANIEVRAPHIPIASIIHRTKMKDAVQLLAFFDFGFGRAYNAPVTLPKRDYLMGIGPGIRYTLDSYIAARLDWGFRVHHQEFMTGNNSMIHFSFAANY